MPDQIYIKTLIESTFGTSVDRMVPHRNQEDNLMDLGRRKAVLEIVNKYLKDTQQELYIDYVFRPSPEAPGSGLRA